jgi:hypothetical protein
LNETYLSSIRLTNTVTFIFIVSLDRIRYLSTFVEHMLSSLEQMSLAN